MDGLASLAPNTCRQRGAKHAHRDGGAANLAFGLCSGFFRRESDQTEVVWLVRVQHFRRTDLGSALVICVPDHSADTSQRYLEPFRLRSAWRKQCSLRMPAPCRSRLNRYSSHRSAWAVLGQVELQQLQQHFGVLHGDWEAEGVYPNIGSFLLMFVSDVSVCVYFQLKPHRQLIGCQGTRHQAHSDLFQESVEDEP